MNYKHFLDTYNQGPEEIYRLFKKYEKTFKAYENRIESLNGQLQRVSKRVSTLELHTKKTLQIAISHLQRIGLVNQSQKQEVYGKKQIVHQERQLGHKGHTLHHVSHPDSVIHPPCNNL